MPTEKLTLYLPFWASTIPQKDRLSQEFCGPLLFVCKLLEKEKNVDDRSLYKL